jgi:phosphate transport system substrate-binding protein
MNDEFLNRMRKEPPQQFAGSLKSRLDQLPAASRRSSALRSTIVALMIGGAAFAVTTISVRGVPSVVLNLFKSEPPPAAAVPAAPAAQPAGSDLAPDERVIPEEAPSPPPVAQLPAPTQLATQPMAERPTAERPTKAPPGSFETMPIPGEMPRAIPRTAAHVVVARATLPFATAISDQLARNPQSRPAKIDILDNGRALRSFCSGGGSFPDIALTSRRITPEELQTCWRNSANSVQEVQVGRQVVVLAQGISNPELKLSTRAIFMALARRIPQAGNATSFISNPATMWQQIGATPGHQQIQVFGPSVDSPVGNALVDLLVDPGCRSIAPVKTLSRSDPEAADSLCRSVRADGLYVDSGEDLDMRARRVQSSPGSVGVFPYLYFDAHRDSLAAVIVDDVAPSAESIAKGTYPGSRVLYLYAKESNLRSVAGANEFVRVLRDTTSRRGAFAEMGLLAPLEAERRVKLLTLQDLQP